MKTNLKLSLGILLAALLLLPTVSAFGVSSGYWENHPLELEPGETRALSVSLQNMAGNKDMRLVAEIIKGGDVVQLIDPDKTYFVPVQTKKIPVNMMVTIPDDVIPGKEYEITISLTQLPLEDQGGVVQMTGAIVTRIPIVVVGESKVSAAPEEEVLFPTTYLVLIALIAVIGLATYLFKKRKRK